MMTKSLSTSQKQRVSTPTSLRSDQKQTYTPQKEVKFGSPRAKNLQQFQKYTLSISLLNFLVMKAIAKLINSVQDSCYLGLFRNNDVNASSSQETTLTRMSRKFKGTWTWVIISIEESYRLQIQDKIKSCEKMQK